MFPLALILGLYSYSIFFLGLLHLLTTPNIILTSVLYLSFAVFLLSKHSLQLPKQDTFSKILFLLLIGQGIVNLIGALGPEIGFDALWYHLTLPKIWLGHNSIFFIPGAQFKYSVMPMLTEMYYFIFPGKLVHYLFGVLSLIVTFKLSRKILSANYSLLATLIFSSNLVFGWESTSAYIDLARTFFEITALYLFLDNKIYKSAIVLGFAVSTKLLALGSLPIFILLLFLKKSKLSLYPRFCFLVIAAVSPWLIRAYLSTGNPFYPVFSTILTGIYVSLDPRNLLNLLTRASDPIHPIYLIIILLLPYLKIKNLKVKIILLYSLLSLIIWSITPNTGGGRFILPYLPALSILAASVIHHLKSKILILVAILYSLFSISYRFTANLKYLQPKDQLLKQKLGFNFGDYYDFDHFFTHSDRVLPLGINNLYYLDSYIALPHEKFDYILLRDMPLPFQYQNWKLVLRNDITNTEIYAQPR